MLKLFSRASSRAPSSFGGAARVQAASAAETGVLLLRNDEELLADHADLLGRIKLCYGADPASFERDLLAPIRNYARFVNALPATTGNFFGTPGGLLRMGLEVGFIALQGSDGRIVAGRSTISVRTQIEPRWRHATFLAGLCSEAHRVFDRLDVVDACDAPWPAYLASLTDWARDRGVERVRLKWRSRPQEQRSCNLFALPQVVPHAMLQHLDTDNNVVVPQLLSCLTETPLYPEVNVMGELVRRATAHVLNRNLAALAQASGQPVVGEHLERFLIDAMRRVIKDNRAWAPNQEHSRVWYDRAGLYLIWPNAAAEIARQIEAEQLPGIPADADAIVTVLSRSGALEPGPDGSWLWSIQPPDQPKIFKALRFAQPRLLLPAALQVRPLDQTIAAYRAARRSSASAAATAAAQQAESDAPGKRSADGRPDDSQAASRSQDEPAAAAATPRPAASHGRPKHANEGRSASARAGKPAIEPAAPPPDDLPPYDVPPDYDPTPDDLPPDEVSPGYDSPPAAAVERAPPSPSDPAARSRRTRAPGPEPCESPPRVRLPMQLDPTVRRVLVDTLNAPCDHDGSPVPQPGPDGFFVSLQAFKERGVSAPTALRALAEAGLVAPGATLEQRQIDGVQTLGILVVLWAGSSTTTGG